ncbi:hypothetical protein PHMEG_00032113 [Phytophthora megakarya]|uniref:Uncharacterized protein n=1 Tax=Phytophthora megakarya TaxID=4795 RepID=A0A225UWQ9_9STRA|nr:hypothetical protein PHMEG_00032113 [Phytophthora megakarya]
MLKHQTEVQPNLVKQRGGERCTKVIPEHLSYLVELLEDSGQLPLYDMIDELKTKYGIEVSPTQFVMFDAVCFTLKKIHAEPTDKNSERVKALRRGYVLKVSQFQDRRKRILHFDETNFNLFCTHNYGWSQREKRAVVDEKQERYEQ